MCSVLKRDGRTVEFDVSKIENAIAKAFLALEHVPDIIDKMIEEAIDKFGRVAYIFERSLAYWRLRRFFRVTNRIKRAVRFELHSTACMATVIFIRVKLLTVSFLEHSHVYRAVWLLRTQNRGNDDNSDSGIMYIDVVSFCKNKSLNKGVSCHDNSVRKLYCRLYGRVHAALY